MLLHFTIAESPNGDSTSRNRMPLIFTECLPEPDKCSAYKYRVLSEDPAETGTC